MDTTPGSTTGPSTPYLSSALPEPNPRAMILLMRQRRSAPLNPDTLFAAAYLSAQKSEELYRKHMAPPPAPVDASALNPQQARVLKFLEGMPSDVAQYSDATVELMSRMLGVTYKTLLADSKPGNLGNTYDGTFITLSEGYEDYPAGKALLCAGQGDARFYYINVERQRPVRADTSITRVPLHFMRPSTAMEILEYLQSELAHSEDEIRSTIECIMK